MKKPYQIEAQRAVKELAEMAADGNPPVQMVLPMAEMVGWLRKGVGELVRQAGLQLMDLLMQEEVRELVGERSQRQADRKANRWGSERGYCVVMGQKVHLDRSSEILATIVAAPPAMQSATGLPGKWHG
jgi:hypothetical protein